MILQSAGNYEAPQYWEKREQIGEEMRVLLNKELLSAHAECKYL